MIEREWIIYMSMATLVWVGLYYGIRFLKLNNHLLGYEWIVLGVSAACGILYISKLAPQVITVWPFLDLFSKLFGVTIIGALGVMRVTNRFELSMRQELVIFSAGLLISYVFMISSTLYATVEIVSFLTALLFLLSLVFLAIQSFSYGLKWYGWLTAIAIVANIALALWRDFSGEGGGTMNIESVAFILQHLIWSSSFAVLFYAYQALGRRKGLL